jgi:hypothetical protein
VTHRALRGALGNFLGTFTSRYSEFEGYWLFGFLVADFDYFEIELTETSHDVPATPLAKATHLARFAFDDQLRKAKLLPDQVSAAKVVFVRHPDQVEGWVNIHRKKGFNVTVRVEARSNREEYFAKKVVLFVTPHDPLAEHPSCIRSKVS